MHRVADLHCPSNRSKENSQTMSDKGQALAWLRRLAVWQPVLTIVLLGCSGGADSIGRGLPEIASFLTKPSDRFLVDLDQITGGHPFKGADSPSPHAGAHVHFDNTDNRWSKANDEPSNFPAIYAVADGTIGRLTTHFPLGKGTVRYGFDLAFAKDRSGAIYWLSYSIEPMAAEPSAGFYKRFILVNERQRVRKGDVIAYLYTPPRVKDCHVHFHLLVDGKKTFLAPAVFTPELVQRFHDQCRAFREHNGGTPIPPCMGYRLKAEENPFGTGALEVL
jgi:hypothetical protein